MLVGGIVQEMTNYSFNNTQSKALRYTDGQRSERRKKVGATRRRTGGKGFTFPSGILLSEVGQD